MGMISTYGHASTVPVEACPYVEIIPIQYNTILLTCLKETSLLAEMFPPHPVGSVAQCDKIRRPAVPSASWSGEATGIAAADAAGGDDKPLLSGHDGTMEAAGTTGTA